MLKHLWRIIDFWGNTQPPSGGCVLKQLKEHCSILAAKPAAFRRLCVETTCDNQPAEDGAPAAFRRLCVETTAPAGSAGNPTPAAFRRLCVETRRSCRLIFQRDPAAFRRLCVETIVSVIGVEWWPQPPSGGCVLKPAAAAGRINP